MKLIVKLFFIFGIAFGSVGFLYSFSQLIALNGLGNIFEMKDAKEIKTEITHDSIHINILYAYIIDGKEYKDDYKMVTEYFEQCNIDSIVVKYNKNFPSISYIDGVPLKIRKQRFGIFMSLFFLLFITLIWKLSNRDKWIRTYEQANNRPWVYPEDKTIKNPWKRFMRRLFK